MKLMRGNAYWYIDSVVGGGTQGFQATMKLPETPLQSTAEISLNAANRKLVQGTGTAQPELGATSALCLQMWKPAINPETLASE